ncbi:MAG: beta-ketoacyl synthase N-terminal-like domain-containing protein [Verrucomicrobiota bacterium]
MNSPVIIAASKVTADDLKSARLGPRFGRLDLASQLALLAVEELKTDFGKWPREHIGICLAARAGSLSTDIEFWKGRDAVGGPSPTLFAYTLPSAAMGEVAIRHKLMGPNLCLTGGDAGVLSEAADMIHRGEAEACVCVGLSALSAAAADAMPALAKAQAIAILLAREGQGMPLPQRENDCDMEKLSASFCALKSETI